MPGKHHLLSHSSFGHRFVDTGPVGGVEVRKDEGDAKKKEEELDRKLKTREAERRSSACASEIMRSRRGDMTMASSVLSSSAQLQKATSAQK